MLFKRLSIFLLKKNVNKCPKDIGLKTIFKNILWKK